MNEAYESVCEINNMIENLFVNKHNDITDHDYIWYLLHYETNGEGEMITWMGMELWECDWEGREYIDKERTKLEPMIPFLVRKIKRYLKQINKLKNISG